jgi:hypothetical protein
MRKIIPLLTLIIFLLEFLATKGSNKNGPIIIDVPAPDSAIFATLAIQQAIDSASALGGGIVMLSEGKYITQALSLKSNVHLFLGENCLLQGSDNYLDYGTGRRNEALISGLNLKNVSITGKGTIDGADCFNPAGEESFRGPHAIRLTHSHNIKIQGITITNSGNYAIYLQHCSYINLEKVNIRGGHDGLHINNCSDITVSGCDFRTGDDAFAGNDNQRIRVTDTKINTACHGFRIGCKDFSVMNCTIWGPAEYEHKISKRNNTISAFTHFSPQSRKPEIVSGNWFIKDVVIDNVDFFFNYNYQDGLWQTGKPMSSVRFENITASNLGKSFFVIGDKQGLFRMEIVNSYFSSRKEPHVNEIIFEDVRIHVPAFFNISYFHSAGIVNTTFRHNESDPIIKFRNGETAIMESVLFLPRENPKPYLFENIVNWVVR